MQFSISSCVETTRRRAFIFGIQHHVQVLYQCCSNFAPGVKIVLTRGSHFYIELYKENFIRHLVFRIFFQSCFFSNFSWLDTLLEVQEMVSLRTKHFEELKVEKQRLKDKVYSDMEDHRKNAEIVSVVLKYQYILTQHCYYQFICVHIFWRGVWSRRYTLTLVPLSLTALCLTLYMFRYLKLWT